MLGTYEKIIEYIDEHINKEITAEDIAKSAGYSRRHLYTFFKANSGVPVMQYVRRRKIAAAASEISADMGKSMYDVALDYGYETPAGFYKAFQGIFGCSPSDYKKNNRRKGFMRKSIEELTNEIKVDPNNAELYAQRGFTYWNYFGTNQNELDKALADFSKAVELAPNWSAGYKGLAFVYKFMRQFDKSIASFDKAIEVEPRDAFMHIERGHICNDYGHYEKALESYTKALEIEEIDKNHCSIAHHCCAECYMALGKYDEAAKHVDKAIELLEYAKYPWQRYELRANLSKALGQHDKALQDYEKAAEFDTPLPWPYHTLALQYIGMGRYDDASAMLYKSMGKNPKSLVVLETIVSNCVHAGWYDKAVVYANEALEIARGLGTNIYRGWAYGHEARVHPHLHRNRALAYEALGEHGKAIADYEKALELAPLSSDFVDSVLKELHERLENLRKRGK